MRRPRLLGRLAAAALVAPALAACDGGGTSGATAGAVRDDSADLMAAAIQRLISRDHTFGQGSHRFSEYLIQDRVDPSPGAPAEPGDRASSRALTDAERAAIAAVVAPFGPHRFIADAGAWRTVDLLPRGP